MSKNIYKKIYFSHDIYSRQDPKIRKMLMHYRQTSSEKALSAYGLFWHIVEDMHIDNYPVDELDMFADSYRCDVKFLKEILENFDLFHQENGYYISDRVVRNIKEQEEKSKKAKNSAAKRWRGQGQPKDEPPKQTEEEVKFDEDAVNKIIKIFNNEFKRSQIVSQKNKAKIYKITQDNNLSEDLWLKVFQNAKRGWNIEGKNKKPSLKNILDNWDLFASDDYQLAPDTEARKAAREQKERKIAELQEKERMKAEEEKQRFEDAEKSIHDKSSAISYLNEWFNLPKSLLERTKTVQEYMKKYDFTIEDILQARSK